MEQRLAVLASGGGSNYRAILQAIAGGKLHLSCPLLITNNPRAGALSIAKEYGCDSEIVDTRNPHHEAVLLRILKTYRVDFVALAGYLRMVPPGVVAAYHERMVNIHPSLLPAFGGSGFYGMRVHRAVVDSGAPVSGATVHFVDNQYDTGPILLQRSVEVLPNDTPSMLAARVLAIEHKLYPEALQILAQGRAVIHGTHVTILEKTSD